MKKKIVILEQVKAVQDQLFWRSGRVLMFL